MRRATGFFLFLATSLLSLPAAAGSRHAERFYQAKQQGITCEAYQIAELRLRLVAEAPGISEVQFFEAMEMELLYRQSRVYDARIDGYLPRASRAANEQAPAGTRYLLFGYVERGEEVVLARVEVVEHTVCAVTWH